MIQALLYQTGKEKKETTEQEGKERPREENPPVQMEETLWGEQEAEAAENFFVEAEEEIILIYILKDVIIILKDAGKILWKQ